MDYNKKAESGEKMKIKFQQKKLEKAIYDFYNATGIKLAILDADFSSIASLNAGAQFCELIQDCDKDEKCYYSDSKILERCSKSLVPETHLCHAGLVDIALPIIHQGTILGYIIMGQMRSDIPFEEIYEKLGWLGDKKSALKKAYDDMVVYDDIRVTSLASLAKMLASYIMTEDIINAEYSLFAENFTAHIHENLSNVLSVDSICKKLGISKASLYRHLRTHFGMTVNEYILKERISVAKQLLKDTDESIGDICENTGVSNPSYFCKIFKASVGISPAKYRQKQKMETR